MPYLSVATFLFFFISLVDIVICFKSHHRNIIFSSLLKRSTSNWLSTSIPTPLLTKLKYVVSDSSVTKPSDSIIESKQQQQQKQHIDGVTIREADLHDIPNIAALRIQVFYPEVNKQLNLSFQSRNNH